MPAVIRRTTFHGGSIRLGPECTAWGMPYTRALSFEVCRVNVAVIGGLTWDPSPEEYHWLETAMIEEGLRMAMDRVVKDARGATVLDEGGNPKMRRVMLPMPQLARTPLKRERVKCP